MSEVSLTRKRSDAGYPRVSRIGQRFGKLEVIALDTSRDPGKSGKYYWICKCDCGRQTSSEGSSLKRRPSCGCTRGRTSWEPSDNGDGTIGIPLTKGYVAIIDASDLVIVRGYFWKVSELGMSRTAVSRVNGRTCLMHRLIIQPPEGMEIDHADGNGLNNVRGNLRICTRKQNSYNRKSSLGKNVLYKGVEYRPTKAGVSRWGARIIVDGETRYLGIHSSQEAAARAYDEAARKYYGEFARPNFPDQKAVP